MKFALIGATGALGRQVLEQGLAQGHDITALVREGGNLGPTNARLRLVTGDVQHVDRVDAALEGQEAVICCLGIGITLRHVTVLSAGTRNLLDAMGRLSVRRIIAVTGMGAGDSRGHGGFLYDKLIEPTVLRTIYEDKDRQEELLRGSSVEWVGVRPAVMTDDAATGRYQVLLDLTGVTAGKIARADVAAFLLTQLTSDEYLSRFPLLTY